MLNSYTNSIKNINISNFKETQKDLIKKIEKGLNDVKEGNYIPAKQFFKEMEEKYKINE